jgi:hypothetical protein
MNNKKELFWNYLVTLFGSAMKTVESLTTPEIGSNLAGVLKKLSQDFKEICLSYIYIQAQKENRTQKIKNKDSKPIYPPPISYSDECKQKPNKNSAKRKRRKKYYKKRR